MSIFSAVQIVESQSQWLSIAKDAPATVLFFWADFHAASKSNTKLLGVACPMPQRLYFQRLHF